MTDERISPMKKKEIKLVITFHTTADAMAMEKACKGKSEGRLIPVPRELSAGCGLSFSTAVSERSLIEQILKDSGIDFEEMAECEL